MSKLSDLFDKICAVFTDYKQVDDTDLYSETDVTVGSEVVQLFSGNYIKPVDGAHGRYNVTNGIVTSIEALADMPVAEPEVLPAEPAAPEFSVTSDMWESLLSRVAALEESFKCKDKEEVADPVPAPEEPSDRYHRLLKMAERYSINVIND